MAMMRGRKAFLDECKVLSLNLPKCAKGLVSVENVEIVRYGMLVNLG